MENQEYYDHGLEKDRLVSAVGELELMRTQELLLRHLPPPPARIADVGGGPGVYTKWLAERGYRVDLIDPVPLHIEQAGTILSEAGLESATTVQVGDARELPFEDVGHEAVLLLGPLYHLTEHRDRIAALRQAIRILKKGGLVLAVAISRFASTLGGLCEGILLDPVFEPVVQRDLDEGQHRNPTDDPLYFSSAYFHKPDDLREELADAGLDVISLYGIEGPAWIQDGLEKRWAKSKSRKEVLFAARALETEESILGLSAHLLAVATPRGPHAR